MIQNVLSCVLNLNKSLKARTRLITNTQMLVCSFSFLFTFWKSNFSRKWFRAFFTWCSKLS